MKAYTIFFTFIIISLIGLTTSIVIRLWLLNTEFSYVDIAIDEISYGIGFLSLGILLTSTSVSSLFIKEDVYDEYINSEEDDHIEEVSLTQKVFGRLATLMMTIIAILLLYYSVPSIKTGIDEYKLINSGEFLEIDGKVTHTEIVEVKRKGTVHFIQSVDFTTLDGDTHTFTTKVKGETDFKLNKDEFYRVHLSPIKGAYMGAWELNFE